MMTANPSASASARNRSPFTATQWQELEHQALIFKYMVAGVPIPPDLIYTVKKSLDSSISSRLFPHQPTRWGCFEMGLGRKVDPEPGRCRRTDGKKWRCSKEAYPDSKYCERHMHRGRNRSRKPVEVSSSTTIPTPPNPSSSSSLSSFNINNISPTSSTISYNSHLSSSILSEQLSHHHNSSTLYPFSYHHSSSSSRPPGYGLSPQNNTSPLYLKSESYSDKDYRYLHGAKESFDELTFFPESSHSHSLLSSQRGYSHPQFQSVGDSSKATEESDEQHCFILGTDFKSPVKTAKEAETQKPLHHFFGEWPPKNTDSWLDLSSNSTVPNNDG
ncbi:hypothetical protein UlMin_016084 [Ulmus minor]